MSRKAPKSQVPSPSRGTWTAESVGSSDVVDSHIPFNIAHETAHGLGIGPEAECNFAAWLACKDSEDVRFRYSGWLLAYIYASNALYSADYEAWYRQFGRGGHPHSL